MSEELRKHHPRSPSTLQSREACPCYESRNDVVHERAIAGTMAHNVVETGSDDERLSDDDAAAAAECLDFYGRRLQLMQEARERAIHEAKLVEDLIELKETYLPVDDCKYADADSTTAGYIDRGIISHDRATAEIFDWKFGMWAVEQAENNLQGIAYSLGMFRAYPELRDVTFWFYQPHLHLIMSASFTRDQIPSLYLRIKLVVERAIEAKSKGDFSMARPMVPNCNFCANLGRCPKVLDFACKVASKFYPLEIPSDITPTMVHEPHNTVLGMRLAQVMATWAKSFRSQITERVIRREADAPEGFNLVQRADREIINRDGYKYHALRYLTEAEYETALSVSLTAVEKLISEKAPRGQKKAQVEQFQTETFESGAVIRGDAYCFLKAIPKI